jgi:hypothetical protein
MRNSYIHPCTPPRFPHKQQQQQQQQQTPSTTHTSTLSPPTNGTSEDRLTVRSPSTSRMITFLQKEMDALRSSSEAARAAAGDISLLPTQT